MPTIFSSLFFLFNVILKLCYWTMSTSNSQTSAAESVGDFFFGSKGRCKSLTYMLWETMIQKCQMLGFLQHARYKQWKYLWWILNSCSNSFGGRSVPHKQNNRLKEIEIRRNLSAGNRIRAFGMWRGRSWAFQGWWDRGM